MIRSESSSMYVPPAAARIEAGRKPAEAGILKEPCLQVQEGSEGGKPIYCLPKADESYAFCIMSR